MTASVQARAAILTVDDDPGVSRSVARDLRRQYGEDYRIVRAESGQQALDALREMKLRGDQVAVLLADYRMPQMNGIEFLEQGMDLHPYARRVLLTAYADTDTPPGSRRRSQRLSSTRRRTARRIRSSTCTSCSTAHCSC